LTGEGRPRRSLQSKKLVFRIVKIKKEEREDMQGFPTAVGQPNQQ